MSYLLGKQRKQGCTQARVCCGGIKSWYLLAQEQLGVVMHPVGPLQGREAETAGHPGLVGSLAKLKIKRLLVGSS